MADKVWTVREILEWTRAYLHSKGDEKSRLAAEWLLSDATGLSRVELYTNFDRPLDAHELARMHEAVARRAAGEPLQYISGELPFRNIVLRCEPGVLIPRPETEYLIDVVLDALAPQLKDTPSRLLDLCCGTGCIGLSLARELPQAVVVATDISPVACALAERNSRALGYEGRVDVLEGDLAQAVHPSFMGSFDALVSNPPYIPTEVLATQVSDEVRRYEPTLALDGGVDGLKIFRRILELAPQALKSGGLLAVELFEESLDEAVALTQAMLCWNDVHSVNDLTGRPRYLVATRV